MRQIRYSILACIWPESWEQTPLFDVLGVVFESGCAHLGPQWESGRCSILVSPGSPASIQETRGYPRGGQGWGGAAGCGAPP